MPDLRTEYLGLPLRSPLVASASPLGEDLENIQRLAEAGAAAIILPSLFEEQILHERQAHLHYLDYGSESHAEALNYVPSATAQQSLIGPEHALRHLEAAKAAVEIPIIASLNGHTPGGWCDYARRFESAGADALELNIYHIPALSESGAEVEARYLEIVAAVRASIQIPLAVKVGPYFSSPGHMACRLADAGADGLVLFNRFYQPDIELEALDVRPRLVLSQPIDNRLPMTWISLLYGHVKADLAATSGIHSVEDVVKLLMAGANVTLLCALLFKRGIGALQVLERELQDWLEDHEYDSVAQLRGSMSQLNCPDPAAFERAQYMKTLQNFVPRSEKPFYY
ncbi:MAG: dihydroorotate dehydrogenase-like protein [Candidatus Sericytochromatia bacterium]|nr:dihydroorotate dehydrogenase-like protein [Candidatus Sericytochromatia bacterium]